jgi:SAM-dependent methyltransferase
VRNGVYGVARRLPPRPRAALLRAARRARDAMTGQRAQPVTGRPRASATPPRSFRVSPAPAPIPDGWPEAPEVPEPGKPVRSVYSSGGSEPRYDVELFEKLNEEYASKPLVPAPQKLDTSSRAERARRRLGSVHDAIGLADKRVLEFGCGAGYEVWFLAHHMGADAYGVDVTERAAWEALVDDRTHLVCADITEGNPFDDDFLDRIISFSVFEHVQHPYKALQELYRIMKPGGLAWISANLYRSAVASHLYRDITFPFPHLLFSDDVFKEFYERRGEKPRGASWVNKLTWSQYERHFDEIGFNIKMLRFSERELDEEFYARFEDVLGRYPRWDLTKDFFTVVLEKPA